jgi:hypothetical protein
VSWIVTPAGVEIVGGLTDPWAVITNLTGIRTLLAPAVWVACGGVALWGGGVVADALVVAGALVGGRTVVVAGGVVRAVPDEGPVALGLFELPQPLIARDSSKTLSVPGLKNRSREVDIRRNDVSTRCDRTADIQRHGLSSTTPFGAGCGSAASDATTARPAASSPRPPAWA